jgi:hypothetical protein
VAQFWKKLPSGDARAVCGIITVPNYFNALIGVPGTTSTDAQSIAIAPMRFLPRLQRPTDSDGYLPKYAAYLLATATTTSSAR